jgi:hypothetical protein
MSAGTTLLGVGTDLSTWPDLEFTAFGRLSGSRAATASAGRLGAPNICGGGSVDAGCAATALSNRR